MVRPKVTLYLVAPSRAFPASRDPTEPTLDEVIRDINEFCADMRLRRIVRRCVMAGLAGFWCGVGWAIYWAFW